MGVGGSSHGGGGGCGRGGRGEAAGADAGSMDYGHLFGVRILEAADWMEIHTLTAEEGTGAAYSGNIVDTMMFGFGEEEKSGKERER